MPTWREVAAVVAACALALMAFTFIDAPAPTSSQDLAAWAQFAGGLLAVWASFRFAAHEAGRARDELEEQRRRDAEHEQREEARSEARIATFLITAQILANQAAEVVGLNRDLMVGHIGPVLNSTAASAVSDVSSVEAQLMAFPLHEMGVPAGVETFAKLRVSLAAARNLFEHMAGGPPRTTPLTPRHLAPFDDYIGIFQTAANSFEKLRVSR